MPFRLKRTVRLAAINAGVLAIGLLAAELIFGGWIGENRGTLVIPRDFSRRFDVSGLYRRDQPLIEFHRDKYGLRGDYRDPSRIGILTVGGSTTNEIFISEGETWSDRLAAEFTAAGTPISVVNAGVDGQSTVGIQKNFELWFPTVLAMHADYVLAYVGINEHAVMESGYLNKQDHLLAQRRVFKQYLMNNSALYTLYRNIRGMIAARRAKLIHVQRSYDGTQWIAADPQPDVAAYEAANADKLARYGETVTRLARAI
ncbi:MAG: hypothetical protein O2944_08370, partial [Proteobacteria bacterium]|nr:hypothetical protein [Pseudomonadota bacterium]